MKPVFMLLSVILSFIIQTNASIFGISLNLAVAAVYFIGINTGTAKGVLTGSVIGMIEDSIGGGMLGPHFLGKGIAGFLSSLLLGSFVRWTPLLGVIGLFFITVIDSLIGLLARSVYEPMPASFLSIIMILLVQGLVNSAMGFFLRPKNA